MRVVVLKALGTGRRRVLIAYSSFRPVEVRGIHLGNLPDFSETTSMYGFEQGETPVFGNLVSPPDVFDALDLGRTDERITDRLL